MYSTSGGSNNPADQEEEENWQAINGSEDYRDYEDHYKRWPNGTYAAQCRQQIVELRKKCSTSAPMRQYRVNR